MRQFLFFGLIVFAVALCGCDGWIVSAEQAGGTRQIGSANPASAIASFPNDGANQNYFLLPRAWYWGSDASWAVHSRMLGQPMPAIALTDANGQAISNRQLSGRIVVLDFWATWCGPCLQAVPHNNQIAARYASRGVTVLGICSADRGAASVFSTARQHDMQYVVARDEAGRASDAFGVRAFPTYAVVDRQGIVRAVGVQPGYIERVIEVLLAE